MILYNESDPFAAEWLRGLVRGGLLPVGEVDGRSVRRLRPEQVRAATQAHFFAGIGGWPYALRLAGWPEGSPVWTGSPPCQPFSQAGSKGGTDDRRHLWPSWFRLIRECRPPIVFGEQVASPDGLAWFDAVSADLEAEGAADLAAAGVGAPHKRQRLFFLAYAAGHRFPVLSAEQGAEPGDVRSEPHARRKARRVGNAGGHRAGKHARKLHGDESGDEKRSTLGDHSPELASVVGDPWTRAEWIDCSDGVRRPVEPGTFPLAHGVPNRVGLLRGFGNAIVPQLAAEFIRASLEAIKEVEG